MIASLGEMRIVEERRRSSDATWINETYRR